MPNTQSSWRTRLAVALAALAAAAGALVVSTSSSPAHGSQTVLRLIGTEVGSDGADVGLPGDSVGDSRHLRRRALRPADGQARRSLRDLLLAV